ncbi:MAG: DUF1223 domain-containing protein [Pseudomonadota bacterium]
MFRFVSVVFGAAFWVAIAFILQIVSPLERDALADDGSGAETANGPAPITVVELFTSQGCSSCPPADKVLAAVAERENVIALSWAVDYWDYLGWKDTFSDVRYSKRQRAYARTFNNYSVYTPQIVVDGEAEIVGSRRSGVNALIHTFSEKKDAVEVALQLRNDDELDIKLKPVGKAGTKDALVRLVWFDKSQDVKVARGENGGRSLKYTHVVRGTKLIGNYKRKAVDFIVPLADAPQSEATDRGLAVLVQQGKAGKILGAQMISLTQPKVGGRQSGTTIFP